MVNSELWHLKNKVQVRVTLYTVQKTPLSFLQWFL